MKFSGRHIQNGSLNEFFHTISFRPLNDSFAFPNESFQTSFRPGTNSFRNTGTIVQKSFVAQNEIRSAVDFINLFPLLRALCRAFEFATDFEFDFMFSHFVLTVGDVSYFGCAWRCSGTIFSLFVFEICGLFNFTRYLSAGSDSLQYLSFSLSHPLSLSLSLTLCLSLPLFLSISLSVRRFFDFRSCMAGPTSTDGCMFLLAAAPQ